MNNYGGWGGYPPPYFMPPYMPQQSTTNPVEEITRWQSALEQMKKAFKEEKREEKKKEGPNLQVMNVALLLLLLSPITGPMMSKFFSIGLSYLPHATP